MNASRRIDDVMLYMAWAFVAARIAHSLVHLIYNNVLHRMFAFAAGLMILIAMWVWQVSWLSQRLCWFDCA